MFDYTFRLEADVSTIMIENEKEMIKIIQYFVLHFRIQMQCGRHFSSCLLIGCLCSTSTIALINSTSTERLSFKYPI